MDAVIEVLKSIAKKFAKVFGGIKPKVAIGCVAVAFVTANVVTLVSGVFIQPDVRARKSGGKNANQVRLNSGSIDKVQVDSIVNRNLFNSKGTLGIDKPADIPEAPDDEDLFKSDLPLVLVGTIFAGDPDHGIALIEDKSSRSRNTLMVGEQIPKHNSKVIEILRERVIFLRNDRKEYIDVEKKELKRGRKGKKKEVAKAPGAVVNRRVVDGPPPDNFSEDGFERKGGKISMTAAYKRKLLTSDLPKVLQDAKATPNMIDGQLRGFKLTKIREESIYHKSGFQNGDTITEINGVLLTSASQAISLLQSLRKQPEIEVRGERNGTPFDIILNVNE